MADWRASLAGAPSLKHERHAFVTWVVRDASYVAGALVLGSSLRYHSPGIQRIVLLDCALRDVAEDALCEVFNRVVIADLIAIETRFLESTRFRSVYSDWIHLSCTRLQILRLTDFSKVLIFDADTLVTSDLSDLFDLPAPAGILSLSEASDGLDIPEGSTSTTVCHSELHGKPIPRDLIEAALKESYGIRGSLLLLAPSEEDFEKMLGILRVSEPENPEKAIGKYGDPERFVGPDEKLITEFYADRWTAIHQQYCLTAWHQNRLRKNETPRALHFVSQKPWKPTTEYFQDFNLWYLEALQLLSFTNIPISNSPDSPFPPNQSQQQPPLQHEKAPQQPKLVEFFKGSWMDQLAGSGLMRLCPPVQLRYLPRRFNGREGRQFVKQRARRRGRVEVLQTHPMTLPPGLVEGLEEKVVWERFKENGAGEGPSESEKPRNAVPIATVPITPDMSGKGVTQRGEFADDPFDRPTASEERPSRPPSSEREPLLERPLSGETVAAPPTPASADSVPPTARSRQRPSQLGVRQSGRMFEKAVSDATHWQQERRGSGASDAARSGRSPQERTPTDSAETRQGGTVIACSIVETTTVHVSVEAAPDQAPTLVAENQSAGRSEAPEPAAPTDHQPSTPTVSVSSSSGGSRGPDVSDSKPAGRQPRILGTALGMIQNYLSDRAKRGSAFFAG